MKVKKLVLWGTLVLGMTLGATGVINQGNTSIANAESSSAVAPSKSETKNVMDTAGVLDQSTIEYIDKVNTDDLATIKGHPQIAVYTEKKLPNGTSIEDQAQQLFDKYKFGTKGYDNGILVILAIKEHRIRYQTGYGMEAIVPDGMLDEIDDTTVQNDFRVTITLQGLNVMLET